ncbi:MAG TPA: hypothetical protein VEV16_01690 [Daejeonella sp.]|nr:hypothetical protein [Daejeonella sp.]
MSKHNLIEQYKAQAEKLYSDLVTRSTALETRIQALNDASKSQTQKSKDLQKTHSSLLEILKNANDAVLSFKSEKQRLANLLKEAQSFYEQKYIPLKAKIFDPDNGLNNTLQYSKNQRRDIERIGGYCASQFQKINKNVTNHTNSLKSLQDLEVKIKKIFSEISIRGENSKKVTSEIVNAKKACESFKTEIELNKKKAKELEIEIASLQSQGKLALGQIEKYKNQSENAYGEILKIYEIAADTGRSGEFDRRRKALSLELEKWENRLFVTTICLLVFVIVLFIFQLFLYQWKIKEAGNDVTFYLRFILASPVIFYIVFSTSQYSKVRRLIDQYTFKTTLAVSLQSHLELLINQKAFQQKGHIDSILQFVLDGLKSIYKEPYNDDNVRLQIKLRQIELNLEKKIALNSRIDKLEEKINKGIGLKDIGIHNGVSSPLN